MAWPCLSIGAKVILHTMTDSDVAPPASNRRSGDRYLACTMAALERPDGEQRPALIHDLSESGALLLVRTTKIFINDDVALLLHVDEPGKQTRTARGLVVRVEHLAPGDGGPWLRRVAIRFHEPLSMHPAEIAEFRRRAERLGMAP
jgi:hypothetical protein